MDLSIIICTFNRSNLLKKCLDALIQQNRKKVEIIVIDNNSTDDTKSIVLDFESKIINLFYILEPKQGLSHARNRGIIEAQSPWILFIDDDAIPFQNLIERSLYLIKLNQYDCVGGMYYGYFEEAKPRWVNSKYGTRKKYSDYLKECEFDVPHGGIVLYRKDKILEVGLFNPNFGMYGQKIAYGEEMELQLRISKSGGKLGFDPELKVQHLVKKERLYISNILIAAYTLGQAHKFRSKKTKLIRFFLLLRSFASIFVIKIPCNLAKLMINKEYYWQNFLIDTFNPTIYHLGRL